MKNFIAALLLMILTFGNASAQYVGKDVAPEAVGPIEVTITDGAKGGCWTNLREVREYTEEKLRIKEYTVVDSKSNYYFEISVTAFRNSGNCIGHIDIKVYTGNYRDNVFGFHTIVSGGNVSITPRNLNNDTLDLVHEIIDKM